MFLKRLTAYALPAALLAAALTGCGSAPVSTPTGGAAVPPPASAVAAQPGVIPPALGDPTPTLNHPAAPPLRKVKIGLALGGGAARGFAHIGVIKALEANGILADVVVGTSAGSVVGALYAAGNNAGALQKMAYAMDEAAISDWALPLFGTKSGVLKGVALQSYINKAVNQRPIEKLKLPFGAVASDLKTGQPILFTRGNTGQAVRASSAVPGVFQPVTIGTRTYVDGGLVAPVPVRFTKEMGAEFIIAVNISTQTEAQAAVSSLEVIMQTFSIMGQRINQYELRDADVVIQPPLGNMAGNDFASRARAMQAGEKATLALMPQIKQKLKARRETPAVAVK
ncbi:patatin-like phospholipase family protein [Pseudoduganella albidiflava]|uniref:Exotoxin n=1 Tax=Pseudoduganella albidiflava TaxID=321983 RepID=A0A411X0T4_9BURK|nr:patatin-like phospholipase family protein [Pseudoduganella albidiflava]QBI02475.1 patatin-like phospholipase family protein [Pseudoduganella albidiflava]GGY42499.1 exotoxin [Pseudoduganella albidiflava]